MNPESFETYEVSEKTVFNVKQWFKEGIFYSILLWNNNVIFVKVPRFINLKVLSADNLNKNTFVSKVL